MTRRYKFDTEWEQALSLLPDDEAIEARTIIENYQQTGEMPAGLKPQMEMILLLVRPMIDRRRRLSAAARQRRLIAKATKTAKSTDAELTPDPGLSQLHNNGNEHIEIKKTHNLTEKKTIAALAEKARRRKRKRNKYRQK